ncbi:acetylajmalan esterase [Phtheirospermum japonicum]|uniref:Acetylajmalan esterase n=1 Tax=Phtheirospermum japonicum TaxID=374723 RepID=A0A830CKJ1_9LAMI|nr:acetylajmalan esterase [Phtheirospermum japonicum]
MKAYSSMLKVICFYLVIQFGTTFSQGPSCPFEYLYHFGDGVTDTGNSIYVLPKVTIPAGRPPYGRTFPGYPTGRWSDGLVDFDYTAEDFGLPDIVPYLTMNHSIAETYHGVIFSVARSPVLDRKFFRNRNIAIPAYAVPLSQQMAWFRDHLKTICTSRSDCSEWIGNSLVLMGDIEGNDIGYALTQGKTIKQVRKYVPAIVKAIIDATRETINLGAKRVIIPGNGPLGCSPYILTALRTNDTTAYDELGCLKSVNDFTIWKNDYLQRAITDLSNEFPDVQILFGPMYDGPSGNSALKSCCGIGGKYNYDPKRFCGDKGVPVCKNPNDYIFWDGLHFTQQTHWEIEDMLVRPALETLNCTPLISAFLRSKRSRGNNMVSYVSSQ